MADPITAAVAWIGAEVGGEVGATLILYSTEIAAAVQVVAAVGSFQYSREQQRRARNKAQDAYNNSLQDRYVMTRGATEQRQMVLGRQRVSGPMVGPFSYGTNKEHLVFVVPLAAHEIDAIEAIYLDDEQVILSGQNVIGINRRDEFAISAATGTFTIRTPAKTGTVSAVAKYGTTSTALTVTSVTGTSVSVSGASASLTGTLVVSYQPDPSPYAPPASVSTGTTTVLSSGNGSVTASSDVKAGSVSVTYSTGQVDGDNTDLSSYASISANVITITGALVGGSPLSGTVTVNYQTDDANSRVRIRQYLGAPGETADAAMISNLPGVWTSAHVGNGVAKLVIECDYSPEAFPGGIPNFSAVVRGAKLYDPRTGQTAWSENNALMMRHVATSPLAGNQPTSYMHDVSIAAAANVCDTSSTYVVNGQTYVRPLYTAGLVFKCGTRPADALNDLAMAMAGKWTYIDGLLRVKAGAYSTPLQTLDETWLAQGTIQTQPKSSRPDVYNVVTGTFADEQQDYQVVPFPRVASAPYIAEDGRELPFPNGMALNAVTFAGQAQQIVATMMRDARLGPRISLTCNMRAFAVEVFDVIYVSLARYGWVLKPFEVLDTGFSLEGGITLSLKATDPSVFALGTSFSAAPLAPNTLLPAPFQVQDIAGLTLTSGVSTKANSEGVTASWTAAVDPGIQEAGGGFEILYGLSTLDPSQRTMLTVDNGLQTKALLSAVRPGTIILVQIRGFKACPSGTARGRWSLPVLHKVGDNAYVSDSLQIAADAATEIYSTTPGSAVTITGQSHTPDGFNSSWNTQVATVSFTPKTSGKAQVFFDGRGNYTNSTASTANAGWSIQDTAGTGTYDGWKRLDQGIAASATTSFSMATTRTIAVTGGTAYTFAVYANKTNAGDTFTVDNMQLRVEVVKR